MCIVIFGINLGCFGVGVIGVFFIDFICLEEVCGILNVFYKKLELFFDFVYCFIDNWGGVEVFYEYFYIIFFCFLGFICDGKNYNFYDDKKLEWVVEFYIIYNI